MLLLLRSLLEAGGVEPPVVVPTYSAEVNLRPVYIRRGKKILLFSTAAQADAFVEAEEVAQEAIERAKSRQARRRVKQRVYEAVEHKTVDIDLLGELAQKYSMPVNIPQLLLAQEWEQLANIALRAMELQEEDDVNLILESEQQEYFSNLEQISRLVQSGAIRSLAAGVKINPPKPKAVKVNKQVVKMQNMSESMGATLAVVMAAIEKMNQPKTVVRDQSGRIVGIA
jgi:hypothetical protein